ncbi:hypothetical protein KM043_004222 [Ampulex compressa]|nr:hypothetical protein KM043_004222 [Ampulex compressa]
MTELQSQHNFIPARINAALVLRPNNDARLSSRIRGLIKEKKVSGKEDRPSDFNTVGQSESKKRGGLTTGGNVERKHRI